MVAGVSEPAQARSAVLRSLREAEAYTESLASLRLRVGDAISAVSAEIGGTATRADRQVMTELGAAWAELDGLIGGVRRAVVEGRRYAESL